MPTASTIDYTLSRLDPYLNPEHAMEQIVNRKLFASTTYAAGTVLEHAGSGVYQPYASGTATGILQYACVTDGSGNITGIDEWGGSRKEAPVYTCGVFKTADLTGLDAGAVTDLGGHLDPGASSAYELLIF